LRKKYRLRERQLCLLRSLRSSDPRGQSEYATIHSSDVAGLLKRLPRPKLTSAAISLGRCVAASRAFSFSEYFSVLPFFTQIRITGKNITFYDLEYVEGDVEIIDLGMDPGPAVLIQEEVARNFFPDLKYAGDR
jgi:hypothetical protein